MAGGADHEAMAYFVLLLVLVAAGPLALLWGADSRTDDLRR